MLSQEDVLTLKPDDRLYLDHAPHESAGYFVSLSKDGKTITARMAELGVDSVKLNVMPIRDFRSLHLVEKDITWERLTYGEPAFKK